jgi:hypothetical protein
MREKKGERKERNETGGKVGGMNGAVFGTGKSCSKRLDFNRFGHGFLPKLTAGMI